MSIEIEITEPKQWESHPMFYVQKKMQTSKEVTERNLTTDDIPLFDEAKAKGISEYLKSMAVRATLDGQ